MTILDDRAYRRDFYQAVDQQQGIDPRQQGFYVPIYERPEMQAFDLVPKLRDSIEFSAGQSLQLMSGFRGCGKTSELIRLRGQLAEVGYRVAYMDIEDFFNTRLPLDVALLPMALAAGFAYALDRDPNRPPVQRFREFLSRLNIVVDGQVGVPGATLDISATVRDDTSFAAGAENAYRNNRRVLRREFHTFFADILRDLDSTQPVVFIVDSIDHWRGASDQFEAVRESVEMTFSELGDDLHIPNIHVVCTIPIYLDVPALGVRRDVVNVKVATREGELFEPGIEALIEVLTRRAPGGDLVRLLDTETARRLVMTSGGLFRDLLRLTRETLLQARALPASREMLARAEMNLREGYSTTFTKEQVDLLREVARTHELFAARDSSSDEAALVSLGAVLRYPNDKRTWYDVHPVLRPVL